MTLETTKKQIRRLLVSHSLTEAEQELIATIEILINDEDCDASYINALMQVGIEICSEENEQTY